MIPARQRRDLLAGLPLAVLLVGACAEPREAAAPDDRPVVPVATVEAAMAELAEPIVASGGVEPVTRVSPGTKLMGRIAAVLVDEGDRVGRGQLLARLEKEDLEAAVEQARAAVEMAEARLANAEAQHRRTVELHGRGSVTEKNLEDAVAGYRVAQAGLSQARANLAAAEVTLGYAEIRSPISGWVVERHVEAGDMAAPGRPFFVLEDLSRVKVAVETPAEAVAGLAEGDTARIEIGGLPGERTAVIHRVVPAGDPGSRTFTVKLLLDNPDGAIKSGMFARARFDGPARQAVLAPEEAVVRRGQLEGLFVVESGRARLRWVKLGRSEDGRVEILSGIEAGERVVSPVPEGLADGSPVVEG